MKVLIIGGTKYFGKIIVRKLLERGDEVWLFTRGQSRPEFWTDVRHVEGDREDYEAFERKLKGQTFDGVIDNVAFKKEDVECAVRTFRGNVGKYLLTSTISIYGAGGHARQLRTARTAHLPARLFEYVDLERCCPIREEDLDLATVEYTYDPDLHPYAEGKRHCEKVLWETQDFHSVALRLPPVLGPEDPSLRLWYHIQRVRDGREIILPDGGRNLFRNMYSADVAQAFIDALDSDRTTPGPYNIAQGEIMTLRRLIDDIARAVGGEPNTVSIPREVLETKTSLPYEDWLFEPFSRPPACIMAIDKARRDFGMRWTPQEEWVRTSVEWYASDAFDGQDSRFYDHRDEEVTIARAYRDAWAEFVGKWSDGVME
jgi:nucleoside-diphosphate-sugar epimerase